MAADDFSYNLHEHLDYRGHKITLSYLLEELEKRADLGENSKGIPFPADAPKLYIPLKEAARLVITWGKEQNIISHERSLVFDRLLGSASFSQVSALLTSMVRERATLQKNLLDQALASNLAKLAEAQTSPPTRAQDSFNPIQAIKDYNKSLEEIARLTQQGQFVNLAKNFLPPKLTNITSSQLTNQAITNLIIDNLARLHAASEQPTDYPGITADNIRRLKDQMVSEEVGNIIRESRPELKDYLLSLSDPRVGKSIRIYTERLAARYQDTTKKSLDDLDKSATAAALAAPLLLPSMSELPNLLKEALPATLVDNQRDQLAQAIARASISESGQAITLEGIVRSAQKNLGFDGNIDQIVRAIATSPAATPLMYHHRQLALSRRFHPLNEAETALANRGINPFVVNHGTTNPFRFFTSEQAFLASEASSLVKATNDALGKDVDGYTPASSPTEALARELASPNLDLGRIHRLKTHLDRNFTFSQLDKSDHRLIARSRFERFLRTSVSRAHATEFNLFERWLDFNEKLPWNKGTKAMLEAWDKLAERITFPGTKIPLFRFYPWILERFDEWKKGITLNWIARTEKSRGAVGKIINWAANQYRLGDFDFSLATHRYGKRQLGKAFNWAISKTTRFASFEALKTASLKATGRFANNLLLKLGGKAAVKLGAEVIAAIAGFASGVGAVIGIISTAALIWDFLKMGWDLLKEYLRNANFRDKINNAALWIGGIATALNLGGIAATLFLSLIPLFTTALVIYGIYTYYYGTLHHTVETTYELDSARIDLLALANGCVAVSPVSGPIMQGSHTDPVTGSHSSIVALDIFVPDGTPVRSANSGTVTFAGNAGVYGLRVDIESNVVGKNVVFIYGHLGSISVSRGQQVQAGQVIGTSDSTSNVPLYQNPHLHFEIGGDITNYAECPIPGTNPTALEGCEGINECNASI